jgi:hypothetical protein
MNVDRLKDCRHRLSTLITGGGDPAAINAQLDELASAIAELEKRPQQYIPVEIMKIPPHWKQWDEDLGYAERPFVRTDMVVVCKEHGQAWYHAKAPGGPQGAYLLNKRDRRKSWKHALTAMHYIDRDHPSGDTRTWAEKEAQDEGS